MTSRREERRATLFVILFCVWLFACANKFGLYTLGFFVLGWLGAPAAWMAAKAIVRR